MATESKGVNQNIYVYSGTSDLQSLYWMANSIFKSACRVNVNNCIILLGVHLIFTAKNL